jgi:putative Mg2+ transporter-C (MgtC) family protein
MPSIVSVDFHGQLELTLRVVVALVLGALIGIERRLHHRPAGLRTMALVAAGAALFSAVGLAVVPSGDPTRIAAQVATGIGFLGAGAIIRHGDEVVGMTTAASIWVTAAIGMAAGFGLYWLALMVTIVSLVLLLIVRGIEAQVLRKTDS